MKFSQVMGMWLQTAFVAKADVRFFGEHTLTAENVQTRTGDAAEVATQSDTGKTLAADADWPGQFAGNGRSRRSLDAVAEAALGRRLFWCIRSNDPLSVCHPEERRAVRRAVRVYALFFSTFGCTS